MTPYVTALAAESSAIREDAPDRYTVQRGDTLWSISGKFLKEPWRWPEVWRLNQEQIRNPHRIYPGDVIVLDRANQQLRVAGAADTSGATGAAGATPVKAAQPADTRPTVKLSPRVRAEPLKEPVPSISPGAIEPFLTRPLVVGENELDGYPFILATQENRVVIGAGNIAYAEGVTPEMGKQFHLFRRGDALIDPDTNEVLGYQAIHLGEARVIRPGRQATIEITRSSQEIYAGDRLVPATKEKPVFAYVPRAPWKPVRGRILSTYGNLGETGPAGVVALSRGAKDGLEVGHVLALYRTQSTVQFETRMSPLFGRQGPTGSDAPRPYYAERIGPRESHLRDYFQGGKRIAPEDAAALPDERYGLVMVFRTFDRAAFGLVMQSSRPVAVNDLVTNP